MPNSNSAANAQPPRVRLGDSDLEVSPIGMGLWPISGISTLGVDDAESVKTIRAAVEAGINFFDSAYSYGYDGRSDRIFCNAIRDMGLNDSIVVATKVGMFWDADRKRMISGEPRLLIEQAAECLQRLETDQVDLLYLHAPDPAVPIETSAEAIAEIVRRGWARYAGVSNVNLDQAKRFHAICPVVAIQPPYNMLQPEAVLELRQFAIEKNISLVCYWVLMKGLLTGQFQRNHRFDPDDRRLIYPIFQGRAWERAQDLLDALREIASDLKCTVSQLVTAWTLRQPGITVALLGAKRPQQIQDTALAMHLSLEDSVVEQIQTLAAHFETTENAK